MEIFIWGGAIGLYAIGYMLFLPSMKWLSFGIVFLYVLSWFYLIHRKNDDPKRLWRYIAEWILGLSLSFLYIGRVGWVPSLIKDTWLWCNAPFLPLFNTLWMYHGICLVMLGISTFYLIRNHKINKEWW